MSPGSGTGPKIPFSLRISLKVNRSVFFHRGLVGGPLGHPLTPFNSLSHPIQQHFGLRGRQLRGKDQFEDAFDQRTLGLSKAKLGGRRKATGKGGLTFGG